MAAARPELLAPVDHAWLRMDDPTNLMMITGLFAFDKPPDLERLRTIVEQRFAPYARFRQRIVRHGQLVTWEEDPLFDVRQHIRRVALPSPGGQQELQDLVSDLMSTPLDPARPLWQFTVIEGVDGGSALVGRLHHAIADGVALVGVLLSMTAATRAESLADAPPEPPTAPTRAAPPAERALRAADRLLTRGLDVLAAPTTQLRLGGPQAVAAALAKLALMPPDSPTLFKGRLGVAKRAAWSQPVTLADVKRIGRAVDATVNDVLLTATAGALRAYLIGRGRPVDGVNLRAAVPVNLRPASATGGLGNRFGLVFLELPLGEADALERLAVLRLRMAAIKNSAEPLVSFGVLNAMGLLPAAGQDLVVQVLASKTTAVMTNVPGPTEPLYFAGAKVNDLMFWVPQSGRLGLGVSIFSYAGRVRLGIATDAGMAADPELIAAAFNDEFRTLLNQI